jgi:methionyl-tRNA formyltransferase
VPALKALREVASVVAVVCQPDRPAGRGLEMRPPPVKRAAIELGLPVHQPAKVKTPDFAAWLRSLDLDVALVLAYGRILPQAVLDTPRCGCMNLHASILPAYRGAAPINWAIVRGETETGVCLMQMDAGMDTGPVLACRRIRIGEEETAGELADRMGQLAAEVVRRDLERAVRGELAPTPQDHARASYAPMLKKQDGVVPWGRSARQVHDHIRGMTPWPGAFSWLRGKMLKIHKARVHSDETPAAPGTVVMCDRAMVVVGCGAGTVALEVVQMEGRRAINAGEMVSGRGIAVGDVLAGVPA